MDLKEQRVLITGGTSGIGLATAALLHEKGARVWITGRDPEKVQRIALRYGWKGSAPDVGQESAVLQLYADLTAAWGGLDILINNAGWGSFAPLDQLELRDMQAMFDTNVFGAMLMAREAAKHFKQQRHGDIVNVASSAASRGFEQGTAYAATKFALAGMTQCWRAELRPFNVRVTQINPSAVTTAFNQGDRTERPEKENLLRSKDIAQAIVAALELDRRAFITELSVWATNPF
jgi:3-oxoacyl-[acyl-carrier protein] reductase